MIKQNKLMNLGKRKNNEILELAIKDVDKNAFEDSKAKLNFSHNKAV